MGKAGKQPVKSSLFEKILRRRVQETYGISTPSTDELIDGLRDKYPEYRRHKPHLFSRMVKQTLDLEKSNGKRKLSRNDEELRSFNVNVYDGDDITSPSSRSPGSKKAKKIDVREQRLKMLETKHVARRRIELQSESSESSSEDGEEDISAVSTSDDEVYSRQFEPEFDLTKSMLRNKYSVSKIDSEKPKSMEIELVTDRETRKVASSMEDKTAKPAKEQKSHNSPSGKDDEPRFKDLGGMDAVLDELKMEVIAPLLDPELLHILGVSPMAGILLHGPPGCGKTKLARAIANESGVPFYKVSSTELVSGVSGASEENIRELFTKAYRTAPSIVFIDEIDAIASKRENLQREMEKRIVTQLMTCMDSTNTEMSDGKPGHVLVIGATNRPDALDPALRRPGRFDREIALGVPDENARMKILSVLTKNVKLEDHLDPVKISRLTPGYVGADLAALMNKAGYLAVRRIIAGRKLESTHTEHDEDTEHNEDWWRKALTPEEKDSLSITVSDIEAAAKVVQPSSRREGFSSIPNVKWEDVGGLDLLRREFHRYIVRRIKYPNEYEASGINSETGFLLFGPPGCGKTLIAKAIANEAGANFIHIQGPEIMNKYVGEAESKIRSIFSNARTCSPCIIFFDEVDALTKKRGDEGGWVVERTLTQLLIELDGGDQRKGVFVIGATNRPEQMDQALLRPGRFGKLMYVSLPNEDQRGLILKALSRKQQLDADVDLIALARSEACANFSGADLSKLMTEAGVAAFEEQMCKIEAAAPEGTSGSSSQSFVAPTIKAFHIEQALGKISPSVSDKARRHYDRLSKRFSTS